MMPKDTKPFNLEHAKAGAPYACRDGREATVLKWDCRDPSFPLAGVMGPEDDSNEWRADGRNHALSYEEGSDLVMLPLGHIDGKPVFVGDEIEMKVFSGPGGPSGHQWKIIKMAPSWAVTWNDDGKSMRWPAPAKQHPVTHMSDKELRAAAEIGRVML